VPPTSRRAQHCAHPNFPRHPLPTCALLGGSNTTVTLRLPQAGHMRRDKCVQSAMRVAKGFDQDRARVGRHRAGIGLDASCRWTRVPSGKTAHGQVATCKRRGAQIRCYEISPRDWALRPQPIEHPVREISRGKLRRSSAAAENLSSKARSRNIQIRVRLPRQRGTTHHTCVA
jgi:hypothetical protein